MQNPTAVGFAGRGFEVSDLDSGAIYCLLTSPYHQVGCPPPPLLHDVPLSAMKSRGPPDLTWFPNFTVKLLASCVSVLAHWEPSEAIGV